MPPEFLASQQYLQSSYDESKLPIIQTYQKAFANEVWQERGICVSKNLKTICESGFSANYRGESCQKCGEIITEMAYLYITLNKTFLRLAKDRNASFYLEKNDQNKVILVAITWPTDSQNLVE